MMRVIVRGILILAILLLVACEDKTSSGGGGGQETPGATSTAPRQTATVEPTASPTDPQPNPGGTEEPPTVPLEPEKLRLVEVLPKKTLKWPVALQAAPGREHLLYAVEQQGRVVEWSFADGGQKTRTVLDLTEVVYDRGSEQGLLGLAFHPEFASNGLLYVNYTTKEQSVIAEYAWKGDQADVKSSRVLLTIDQPYSNHNGGHLAFGPDGMLYIGTGDGGSGGDPHNNSQNPNSLLGKMLRLDVNATEPKPEMYALGLRNPWKYAFDSVTGELWVADVGQDAREEINILTEGGNYGWKIKEGTACYKTKSCNSEGLIDPVWEYTHRDGSSITGGYVYRGEQLPELYGMYVFGDYISGKIWGLVHEQDEWRNEVLFDTNLSISSFGVDAARELYVVSHDGDVYRIERVASS